MTCFKTSLPLFAAAMFLSLFLSPQMKAQVTTATIYGDVHDATGAVVPRANVVAKHQGTGISKDTLTDDKGEFALSALPTGPYTVTIELGGFKTLIAQGIELGAGQTIRQTFALEVGQIAENVTVAENAPLVATASAAQEESIGRTQVSQLPLARRSLEGLATLAPGASDASVGLAGSGSIRLNGVAEGGTAITVDGTDAIANPETRGINQYGGQNQISIMSIDAVAEVQVIKGILPAEYGGVVGGQINIISRSGTNEFHGSAIENYQNEAFFARDTFLPASKAKPTARFNQYGGALGGPILKNRLFFFAAYEGYRDSEGVSLTATVPSQALRDQLVAALPFAETSLALAPIPLPTQNVNAQIGNYFTANQLKRHDNSLMTKGDVTVFGGNLSVTYNRSRPYALQPSIFLNGSDDQNFTNANDRVAAQYVKTRSNWVFETRYGFNRTNLDRIQSFWNVQSPGASSSGLTEVGDRVSLISISNLFTSPSSEVLDLRGRSFSFDQKVTRIIGSHLIKMGFNWGRQAGSKTDPQNTNYVFQTVAAALANTPTSVTLYSGQPPHDGHLDTYGLFIQDDWRVTKKFVLNLGLRADFYPNVQIHATSNAAAQIYNLNSPTSLQKLDFGSPRDPNNIYNPDWNNLGPRVGFAWNLGAKGNTVIRGGSGLLFSQQLYAMFQNQVTNPLLPATVTLNQTDAASLGIQWPLTGSQIQNLLLAKGNGQKTVFSLIDTNLKNPYTIQTNFDVEQALGGSWMAEVGYQRTDGADFPMELPLAQAFDRATGARPNPALGTPSGYYITSQQTMVYNALLASVRKRFATGLGLDFHYTLSRGWADQGGALSSAFVNSDIYVTQDFFNPFIDREPLSQEARHRVSANVVYELPKFKNGTGFAGRVLDGWQVSSIFTARTGVPLRIVQPSGIANSRPDFVGGDPVLSNYQNTLLYLNKASFAAVPTYATTNATVRAGTQNPADVRGPGQWTVNASIQKTVRFSEKMRLEIRADSFNLFNHVNYNSPNTTLTSPIFGTLTSDAGPRSGQVGAKFVF
jgi:hypothetical protein